MIFKVGKVLNYFPNTKIVIVKLTSDISISDSLIFCDLNEQKFGQKRNFIQFENERVDSAKSGKIVGIKSDTPVLKDTYVYKNI